MNQTLAEKITKAREAVEGQEEPYKTEAFKIVLAHLLNSSSAEPDVSQGSTPQKYERKTTSDIKPDLKIGKSGLASYCGISINELDDVFSVTEDKVEMIVTIPGNEAEQQIIASQCLLAAYEIILGEEWVDSPILSEGLRAMGIRDKGRNRSTNLKRKFELFRLKGKAPHIKYKLTSGSGRSSAFKIIRKLAKGEKLNED